MDSVWQFLTEIRPGSRMIFAPEKLDSIMGINGFLSFLDLDQNTTFELNAHYSNPLNQDVSTFVYQQFSNGIPVLGGGYTVSGIFAPGTGPDGPT